MKGTIRKEKGITLIALVVTIIVLLILAGIAISMVTGDNSLLQKAADAKIISGEAAEYEQIRLAVMAAKIKVGYDANIDENMLNNELEKILGTGNYSLSAAENGYTLSIRDGEITYAIDNNGNITKIENAGGGSSSDPSTETRSDGSNSCALSDATSDCAKKDGGYAKVTLISGSDIDTNLPKNYFPTRDLGYYQRNTNNNYLKVMNNEELKGKFWYRKDFLFWDIIAEPVFNEEIGIFGIPFYSNENILSTINNNID